jgi:hypothetical protein
MPKLSSMCCLVNLFVNGSPWEMDEAASWSGEGFCIALKVTATY